LTQLDARTIDAIPFLVTSSPAEIAQEGGANLLNSVYAGTIVRALADCKKCVGGCRLWFMDDTEAPMEVCPYFCLAEHQERIAC